MAKKLNLKFNKDNFSDFVTKLQDLSNIEDVVKIKINSEKILMYSMISNDVAVLALKTYLVDTSEYIENFNEDTTFDLIITGSGKVVKNLKFFNGTNDIKASIEYKPLPDDDDIMHVRNIVFSDGKLKISCIGGEQFKIRDVTIGLLEKRMDIRNSKWSFKADKQDFADIKKLCSINEDKILNINILNKKVMLSESSKWEIEVDEIDYKDHHLIFGKKYLSNINANVDEVRFHIFDTFILVKDINSNLMLSFEQTFDED